ncbi:MAG TPA: HEAT repeat domain-containing protein [Ktedonobacterales bacterium]|nr:HEAT repeat domain-containing protein [Ktedonobacterales bacterium]
MTPDLSPERIIERLANPTPDRRPLMQEIRQYAPVGDVIAALQMRPKQALTRQILCDILGYRPDTKSIPVLVQSLNDRAARVRRSAADALGKLALANIRDVRVGPALLARYLRDRRPDGSPQTMLAALGAVKYAPALPTILSGLESENAGTRKVAAWALMKLAETDASEPLKSALAHETDTAVAAMIQQAIGKLKRI